MGQQLIIVIGREYGSGGREIARRLAEKFGLPMYDRNLLNEVAAEQGMNIKELEQYDELPHNKLMFRTVNGFNSSPEANVAQLQFDFLKKRVRDGESFVVVGRCADEVLKGVPGLITFFVVADQDFKRKRLLEYYGCKSVEEADATMLHIDRKRKYYYEQFAHKKWGTPKNFDLFINSARLGIEGTVALLAEYVRARMRMFPEG